ncbi:TIGR00341 family protein [bacterium]|nr:TIGR00341 family protein [bacterium]MBU1433598.1 TIGR00341 family protein [bacterium]MBU1503221.1 TIGR00341 family protein [bacterium]
MYKNVKIICDELRENTLFEGIVSYIREHHEAAITIHSHKEIFEESSEHELFLLFLDDDEIKMFFHNHLEKNLKIALLPNENAKISMKNYGISTDVFEAVDDAFNEELLSEIDILLCNENISFSRIVIGDMHGMNRLDFNENNIFQKIAIFWNNLKDIRFKSYTLETSKEQKVQTAASGITILEHSISTEKSTISDTLSIHDGKLHAFILAPTSILAYLWYLISIFVNQRISISSLPKSLGFIKSSCLKITSNKPIEYLLDGALLCAKELELKVWADALRIHLGRSLQESVKQGKEATAVKDSIKLNTLPVTEMSDILVDGKLPLFKVASDEEFKELFLSLRSSSKFSYVYLTLMILSTLLATTGLFANSAPVIIGAMILAPLMAPIISLAMGMVRAEEHMVNNSLKTLAIGIGMALLFSCVYTLMMPLEQITGEMQGRLHPNVLDLLVAIFSGIAGAYAYSKEEVAKSLAGVAIAVALVPPLSVTGIGIGLGNLDVIYGSFLLFTTNLVGITLSAALTFVVLGYAPLSRGKKGLYYTAALLALVTLPLALSFYKIVEKNDYLKELKSIKHLTIDGKDVELVIKGIVIQKEELVVDLDTVSSTGLHNGDFNELKEILEKKLDKKVVLEINSKIVVR